MRRLARFSQILETPLETGANFFLLLILVLIFSEVISRFFFSESHGFMEEFSRWSQIWLVYFILGVIEKRRKHLIVDILPRKVPQRYKDILLITSDVVTIVFAALLFWGGIAIIERSIGLGTPAETTLRVPIWIGRVCVPFGALFLAFFAIENLIKDICSFGKPTGDEEQCLSLE